MAFLNSDQMAKVLALPPQNLKPNEAHGDVHTLAWTFTTPAGGVPINDVVRLGKLPKGARVLRGRYANGAMTTGAGVATAEIGTYADDGVDTLIDVDAFQTATSVDAAGEADFGNTIVKGFLSELSQNVIVGAKATVEAWAAAQGFHGVIEYAL